MVQSWQLFDPLCTRSRSRTSSQVRSIHAPHCMQINISHTKRINRALHLGSCCMLKFTAKWINRILYIHDIHLYATTTTKSFTLCANTRLFTPMDSCQYLWQHSCMLHISVCPQPPLRWNTWEGREHWNMSQRLATCCHSQQSQ